MSLQAQNDVSFSADETTIVAQATPCGSGALALIRMSGVNAISIAEKISLLPAGKKIIKQPSHTIHYGLVVDCAQNTIDQVMFAIMRGPKTFTGQDTVEITAHNNPFIVNNIIKRAIEAGARPAKKGEFSKRAFLNGKIDLAQAEAIHEVIAAQTQVALKASLEQLEGSLSKQIKKIENDLIQALALSEASFEFIEDESMEFDKQITSLVEKTVKIIDQLKQSKNSQKQIRQGVRIALLGSVNAGKSSLFNKLVGQNRAIVTNTPGTTRDVIESGRYKNGTYQTILDTAGLRKTNNEIEKEGIKRSEHEAQKTDIILLVYDGSQKLSAPEIKTYKKLINLHKEKVILVCNKSDLKKSAQNIFCEHTTIPISCKQEKNIELLEQTIEKKIKEIFANSSSPFLLNQRHYNLLFSLEKKLNPILTSGFLGKNPQYELISFHLKEALTDLSELSGKTITKQSLDKLFQSFCIGK